MKLSHCLLALAIGASLAGCNAPSGSAPANTGGNTPAPDTSSAGADALVARVNQTMVTEIPQLTSADWLASTYINDDSAAVASAANERWLAMLGKFVAEAARFAANLQKEGLSEWIPPALEVINAQVSPTVTPEEVERYYRSDARLWEAMLKLRRADRWWQRRVRRRDYPFLLPGHIDR